MNWRPWPQLASDTDTEVVAHLITKYLEMVCRLGTRPNMSRLRRFRVRDYFAGEQDLMIAAGEVLAIGYGDGEIFIGSDAMALAPLTQQITYLEGGDWALVTGSVTVRDAEGPSS